MAHRHRKCVSSPACSIAVAGGKRRADQKHALMVATFAEREHISTEDAVAVVGRAVHVLLDGPKPSSLSDFAESIGTSIGRAASLVDVFIAFGYLKGLR